MSNYYTPYVEWPLFYVEHEVHPRTDDFHNLEFYWLSPRMLLSWDLKLAVLKEDGRWYKVHENFVGWEGVSESEPSPAVLFGKKLIQLRFFIPGVRYNIYFLKSLPTLWEI